VPQIVTDAKEVRARATAILKIADFTYSTRYAPLVIPALSTGSSVDAVVELVVAAARKEGF
jgi:hypothetical protein